MNRFPFNCQNTGEQCSKEKRKKKGFFVSSVALSYWRSQQQFVCKVSVCFKYTEQFGFYDRCDN